MTFIRPSEHRNIWRLIFAIGGFLLAAEMATIIYFYNRNLNLDVALDKAKNETQQIGSDNALLVSQVASALDKSVRLRDPYSALVEDAHPEYFSLRSRANAQEFYAAVY